VKVEICTVDLESRARLCRNPFSIDVGQGFEEGLVFKLSKTSAVSGCKPSGCKSEVRAAGTECIMAYDVANASGEGSAYVILGVCAGSDYVLCRLRADEFQAERKHREPQQGSRARCLQFAPARLIATVVRFGGK
jgi:hypothetical protein